MLNMELDREKDQVILMANAFNVTSQETYQVAGTLLTDMKALEKKIEEAFNPIVELAHQAHKKAIGQRDVYLKPVKEAGSMVRGKMSAWITEDTRKREEEQRRINEANKQSGEMVEVKIESPKVAGISTRKQWLFKITNRDLIPKDYWTIDEKAIQDKVNELKDKTSIPGVEVYSKEVIITR